jgi:glucokinase
MILAGDVGGTKTNLGLFDAASGTLRLLVQATFASADFPGLSPVVQAFLHQPAVIAALAAAAGSSASGGGAGVSPASLSGATVGCQGGAIAAACFGVAGPVIDNRSSTPNLAWEIDGDAVAAAAEIPAVRLINDLVATAEGIALLAPAELVTVQAGAPEAAGGAGNQVLIAAGTGLGMALLPMAGGTRVTIPSEGGHTDYAPRDEDEVALMLALRRRFGEHVSTERVVSGPGLHAIYEHLRDAGFAAESLSLRASLAAGDPSKAIANAGLAGADALSERALDLFTAAYGAAAGNLALIGTATGGVYIGGGIAPKILPKMTGGGFLRAFLDKGRFSAYLERIPVRVILDDHTAMLGAARCAAALHGIQVAAVTSTKPTAGGGSGAPGGLDGRHPEHLEDSERSEDSEDSEMAATRPGDHETK